jgi:hypothetical protein
MPLIDKTKTYRTRDGAEVRFYVTDGAGPHPIHGAIKAEDGWYAETWTENGFAVSGKVRLDEDLIEVKPRIQMERWENLYRGTTGRIFSGFYATRAEADKHATGQRIACVACPIDCGEGEGL